MMRRALAVVALLASALVGAPAAHAALVCTPTTVQPRKSTQVVQPTARLKAITYTFTVRTNCGTIKIAADAKAARDAANLIVSAAAAGGSVSDIADEVNLSEGTVRNHLSSIIGKTMARNRADAARIAQESGWL